MTHARNLIHIAALAAAMLVFMAMPVMIVETGARQVLGALHQMAGLGVTQDEFVQLFADVGATVGFDPATASRRVEYTLFGSLEVLWTQGMWLACALIAIFAVVLPVLTLVVAVLRVAGAGHPGFLAFARMLAMGNRFQLVDVLGVAILVVVLGSAAVTVTPGPGFYGLVAYVALFALYPVGDAPGARKRPACGRVDSLLTAGPGE